MSADAKEAAGDAAQAVANETAALDGPSKNSKALSVREYLDTTVTPVLLKAMSELVDVRPDDPVEWLAAYLIKNNPSKKEAADAETAGGKEN